MKKYAVPIIAIALAIGFCGISYAGFTEKIVWTSERSGNSDIWIMNPDGTDKVQLTTDLGGDLHPIISPQGKKIAFCSERTGTFARYNGIWGS